MKKKISKEPKQVYSIDILGTDYTLEILQKENMDTTGGETDYYNKISINSKVLKNNQKIESVFFHELLHTVSMGGYYDILSELLGGDSVLLEVLMEVISDIGEVAFTIYSKNDKVIKQYLKELKIPKITSGMVEHIQEINKVDNNTKITEKEEIDEF